LERRRERREKLRDETRDERELRRAARLVHEELREALWTIVQAVDHYTWWPHPSRTFTMRRWHEFAPVFAGSSVVTGDQWSSLTFAYEDLQDCEAKLDAHYRSRGELPPFGFAEDQALRWLWESVDEGRQAAADLAEQEQRIPGFDRVAAMYRAAEQAAKQLMPASQATAISPPEYRSRMEVKTTGQVTGIALVGAPLWQQFTANLPLGVVLTTVVPEVAGSSACVMSPLGARGPEDEATVSFVPDEIRDDDSYEDFVLIIGDQQRRQWLKELPWTPEHDG
jgi:hypothetical protein